VLKTEVCDCIIAPGYEPEALEILKTKKKGAFIMLAADENFQAPIEEFREVNINLTLELYFHIHAQYLPTN
jgi:phosphoribosylaminoimidazolecarboxamide formyltransferase/IMP cyclohydrolase